MLGDELGHLVKQLVGQAMIDQRPFVYGHIANYDPNTHRVRCIVPSMQDDNGTPLLTPWMPIGGMSAGAGFGAQVIYAGGATAANPTGGEQVVIGLFDRHRGVSAALGVFYNGNALPPATALPDGAQPVAAGDVLLSNGSKSLLRIRANGDIEIWGTAKLIANITGDANVDIKGDASVTVNGATTVTSSGTATISAPLIKLTKSAGDALLGFCTDAFRTVFNTHIHGTGPPPTPQAGPTTVTKVVTGE